MASHYMEKCEHGTLVAQCRCPSLDKPVRIVPCPVACPFNVEARRLK